MCVERCVYCKSTTTRLLRRRVVVRYLLRLELSGGGGRVFLCRAEEDIRPHHHIIILMCVYDTTQLPALHHLPNWCVVGQHKGRAAYMHPSVVDAPCW